MSETNGTTTSPNKQGDKVSPKKQTTMEATAEAGIQYLKDHGKEALINAQGLTSPKKTEANGTATNGAVPSLDKSGTMVATAEEGHGVLESLGGAPDKDARTRGQAHKIDNIMNESEGGPDAKRARVTRGAKGAAAEAEEGSDEDEEVDDEEGEEGDDVSDDSEDPEDGEYAPPTGASPPKRTRTMEQTLAEGAAYLHDDAKPTAKRTGTMEQAIKEGHAFVGDEDNDDEGSA